MRPLIARRDTTTSSATIAGWPSVSLSQRRRRREKPGVACGEAAGRPSSGWTAKGAHRTSGGVARRQGGFGGEGVEVPEDRE